MPQIPIKHVVSFSSEDKVHKAENMLNPESYRKWKCASPGEKNASIVLQFEKATKIHSIDIGNESSAFVEVLVGRSSDSVKDFQVLLLASSFMSPLESRNGNNVNRVRMFDSDKLAQNLKDEKWDCVQVVCTQPFNKNISYGLSFIKFHSPPEKNVEQVPEKETKSATKKLGSFVLKYDDEEEEEEDTAESPVLSWKQNKNSVPSFSPTETATSTSQSKPEKSDLSEYEKMVLKNKQEQKAMIQSLRIKEAAKDLLDSLQSKKTAEVGTKRTPSSHPPPLREKNTRIPTRASSPPKESKGRPLNITKPTRPLSSNVQTASTSSNSNKVAVIKNKKPFHKLMDKVVFVISGFVNPLRGEIRDKALEMGAKYKGDWDQSCTHLVCAFINTPKYIQVRGENGKVVTKEWIIDCYKKKTLLPWKSYMLGKYSKSSTEEESESDSEERGAVKNKGSPITNGNHSRDQKAAVKRRARFVSSDSDSDGEKPAPLKQQKSLFGELSEHDSSNQKPGTSKTTNKQKAKSAGSESDSTEERSILSSHQKSKTKSLFGDEEECAAVAVDGSETEDEDAIQDYLAATDVDSDGDTEDEIRKVEEAQRKRAKISTVQESLSESEDSASLLSMKPDTTGLPLPDLPNLFKKRHFLLYGQFSSEARHDLQRFITAYNGLMDEYMSENVKYVVTEEGWDQHFEDALEENEDLIFVKPEWIYKCHETQKCVPYQAYIVIPN